MYFFDANGNDAAAAGVLNAAILAYTGGEVMQQLGQATTSTSVRYGYCFRYILTPRACLNELRVSLHAVDALLLSYTHFKLELWLIAAPYVGCTHA